MGRSLLKFMSEDLHRNEPDCLAFVIPNPAAQRTLASIGWATGGRLIPHVFVLNPEQKLHRIVRRMWLARLMGRPAARIMRGIVRKHRIPGYSLRVAESLDSSFDAFWQGFDKTNRILSDRGIGSLTWRYVDHPHCTFRFVKLFNREDLAGYLVYECAGGGRECVIYDLLLRDGKTLGCLLALFVEHIAQQGGIDSIRFVVNSDHPYRRQLWTLGFVPRKDSSVFQLHGLAARSKLETATWFLTSGDKDI